MSVGYHDPTGLWRPLLEEGLKEDGWPWDWTTRGCLQASVGEVNEEVSARIVAKSAGVWAAEGLASAVREISGQNLISSIARDRQVFRPGDTLVQWRGDARWILALERPFLNLASYVSGIATQTAALVDMAKKKSVLPAGKFPRITSTRKTLPGYRDLALHGILCGGGHPHRTSLAGGVLIKENHIALAGGVTQSLAGTRRIAPHGLKIEIEVRSLEELKQALASPEADAVMLDNFSPDQVRQSVELVRKAEEVTHRKITIEVSGGITIDTISAYIVEGVDILSSGSLTHSVKAVDLSLLLDSVR